MTEINVDDNDRQFIPFSGLILRETDKAVQFAGERIKGGMTPFWLPKSQLGRIWYAGDEGAREIRIGKAVKEIEIPFWLAKEHGLK